MANTAQTRWQPWGRRLARAFSLRVIFFSFVFGFAVYALASFVWSGTPLAVMWTAAAAVYVMAVTNDEQMLRCDACGKRVKLGAVRCHHCGYLANSAHWPET